MKKILKYSTILGVAGMLTAFSIPTASADTGGYTRFKVMDSHWNSLGFGKCDNRAPALNPRTCKFASASKNVGHGLDNYENKLIIIHTNFKLTSFANKKNTIVLKFPNK